MSHITFTVFSAELMTALPLFQIELLAAEARSHCCCLVQHLYECTGNIVNYLISVQLIYMNNLLGLQSVFLFSLFHGRPADGIGINPAQTAGEL